MGGPHPPFCRHHPGHIGGHVLPAAILQGAWNNVGPATEQMGSQAGGGGTRMERSSTPDIPPSLIKQTMLAISGAQYLPVAGWHQFQSGDYEEGMADKTDTA